MFATPWRLVAIWANGQLAFACYQGGPEDDRFRLGAITVLTLRAGRIMELAAE
jgi:RNA polymerase sigma-70 factor (ECF subfamily)